MKKWNYVYKWKYEQRIQRKLFYGSHSFLQADLNNKTLWVCYCFMVKKLSLLQIAQDIKSICWFALQGRLLIKDYNLLEVIIETFLSECKSKLNRK